MRVIPLWLLLLVLLLLRCGCRGVRRRCIVDVVESIVTVGVDVVVAVAIAIANIAEVVVEV